MRLARVLLASAGVAVACSSNDFLGPPAPRDNVAVFDQMWTAFDRHYSFFDLKGVDWQALGDRYRPLAIAAPDDAALASTVGRMLAELKDVHVAFTPAGAGSTMRYLSQFDTAAATPSLTHAFATPDHTWRKTSGNHIQYGFAASDIGYVAIPSFRGTDWDGEIDEALRALSGTSGLIVDVRNNPGGSVQLAVRIAGRFAERSKTYGYVRIRNGPAHSDFTDYVAESVGPTGAQRFRGPVYVLTDRRTASSAEDFVLALRTMETATIVGDTTTGASGGPVVRELSNGWTYQMSEWIEYTPDRRTFEDVGLAPDVVVRPTGNATLSAGSDPVYNAALALAQRRGTLLRAPAP